MPTAYVDGRDAATAVQALTDLAGIVENRLAAARDAGLNESADTDVTLIVDHADALLHRGPEAVRLTEQLARSCRKAAVTIELRMTSITLDAFGGSMLLRASASTRGPLRIAPPAHADMLFDDVDAANLRPESWPWWVKSTLPVGAA